MFFLPVTGVACSRWGTLAWSRFDHAGQTLATLGGTLAHVGHARETLVTLGEGTLAHAGGECLLTLVTLEDADHARGNAGALLRSSGSLLGCWSTPRTSLLVVCGRSEGCLEVPPFYSWIRAVFSSFLV